MKYYYYDIQNNKIDEYNGEVSGTSDEFKHYTDKSFGVEEIHYKVTDGKVSEVICEAFSEAEARKAVKEFLDNLK